MVVNKVVRLNFVAIYAIMHGPQFEGWVAERSKATVLKTVALARGP